MAQVGYSTIVKGVTFDGKSTLTTVDINNRPIEHGLFTTGFRGCTRLKVVKNFPNFVKDMSSAFYDCISLETIPEIPSGCENMAYTFVNCSKFNSKVIIPNSVINVDYCFKGCVSLTKQPDLSNKITSLKETFENTALTSFSNIPNGVIDMGACFRNCTKLISVSDLPSPLIYMKECFKNCTSLTTIPVVPDFVEDLDDCFYNCQKLSGDIVVRSTNVKTASRCFYLDESIVADRNVFIDLNSTTYQTFTSSGYSTTKRKHGVLLLPLGYEYVTFTISGSGAVDASNAVVKVTYDGVEHTCLNTLTTHGNGVCSSGVCMKNRFYLPIPANKSFTYTVNLDNYNTETGSGTTGTGNKSQDIQISLTNATKTFSVNVTPSGSHVELYRGSTKVAEGDNTASYGHITGNMLAMKIVCTNANYPTIQQSVSWNTNSNYVKNIDMIPVSGEVLYESNTGGQVGTLQLGANRLYEIICIGGGGGSGTIDAGGAGAFWKGNINTSKSVTLTMTTGSGGQAGASNVDAQAGTASIIDTGSESDEIKITTEGGMAGSTLRIGLAVWYANKRDPRYANSYSIGPKVSIQHKNTLVDFSKTEKRQVSWLNGTTYGMGANVDFQDGKPGYIKITHLGELTPTSTNETEVFKRTTSGSGNVQLEAGTYRLICVGGGGGALIHQDNKEQTTAKSYKATGGSGSYLNVVVQLEAGTYDWSVGALGTTAYYSDTATNGGNTTFGDFIAYGGQAAIFLASSFHFASTGLDGTFAEGYGGSVPMLANSCIGTTKLLQGNDGQKDKELTTNYVLAGGASQYLSYGKGSGFKNGEFFAGPNLDAGTAGCLIIFRLN